VAKRLSGRTRKRQHLPALGLVQAAWGATMKKNCYLSSQYFRLVKRLAARKRWWRGPSLFVIIYHVFSVIRGYHRTRGDSLIATMSGSNANTSFAACKCSLESQRRRIAQSGLTKRRNNPSLRPALSLAEG